MTIRLRILSSLGLLLLLFVLASGYALFSTGQMLNRTNSIFTVNYASIERLLQADRDAYQSTYALAGLLRGIESNTMDETVISGLQSEISENAGQVIDRFNQFEELNANPSVEMQAIIDQFPTQHQMWDQALSDITQQALSGEITAAFAVYQSSYQGLFSQMRNSIDVLTEFVNAEAEDGHGAILKSGRNQRGLIQGITGVGVIVAIAIGFMVYLTILTPIVRVNDAFENLTRGSGDLSIQLPVNGKDELAKLSADFNSFVQKTADILKGLVDTTEKTMAVKSNLISAIEQNSSAATEISANVGSITSQITKQNEDIHSISQNVEEMSQGVSQLDHQIQEQGSMITQSAGSVDAMMKTMEALSEIVRSRMQAMKGLEASVQTGENQIMESNRAVQAIHGDIDDIINTTNVISDISAQTNLLAMNAAIEAAHAGDAGRGFAVVAVEIRKLAESSNSQSKSISEILKRIIENIEQASKTSEFTSATYKEILVEFEKLTTSFQDIISHSDELYGEGKGLTSALTELNEFSDSVTQEATRIRSSNDKVTDSMRSITQISRGISEATAEINIGMEEISSSLEAMRNDSAELEENMEASNAELSKFTL